MSAKILDGKSLSEQIREEIARDVAAFRQATDVQPCLAAILVGDDPASHIYVRNKEKACEKAGIESRMYRLSGGETTTESLLALVDELNNDPDVHGILVQSPLPSHCDETRVLDAVSPHKDVDAFHPTNVGLISQGRPRFLPCTPHGIIELLRRNGIETRGKYAVVIGRSDIVGKPMALMLVQKGGIADCTVTVCHSRTTDLPSITRQADILIVAIGRARFVTADMVKPGAVVIDVGMNRTPEKLCGDVDFDAVKEVASAITPVPGGVGLLTVTMLLRNTLEAAKQLTQKA